MAKTMWRGPKGFRYHLSMVSFGTRRAHMAQITARGIDEETAKRLRRRAERGGRQVYVWSPESNVHEPDRFGEITLE
jgi:hypothetical protein